MSGLLGLLRLVSRLGSIFGRLVDDGKEKVTVDLIAKQSRAFRAVSSGSLEMSLFMLAAPERP